VRICAPRRAVLGGLLLERQRQQPGAQHAHAGLLVLQLALLVLHGHGDAGGDVGDAHGGVGGVDALPAGAAGAVDVDAQVVLVDRDVDLLGLGQHEHPAAEVWMRPWLSVTGTRCTRCTPPSYFNRPNTGFAGSRLLTAIWTSL
jgi:hypothetical protein